MTRIYIEKQYHNLKYLMSLNMILKTKINQKKIEKISDANNTNMILTSFNTRYSVSYNF